MKPHDPHLSELIDSRTAAEILGRTTKTVSIYVAKAWLLPVHQGRGLRGGFWFRRSDVVDLANTLGRQTA